MLTTPVLGSSSSSATQPPNILIIITDDQRSGLSVMPNTVAWFKDGGVNLTNTYATTPLCCPSRASIFTGRYAHNHSVKTNVIGGSSGLDQQTTLQYYLHNAGYTTAFYGKYLNAWPLASKPPYFNDWATTHSGAYRHHRWNIDGQVSKVNRYNTGYIGDRALQFVDQEAQNPAHPWLLYLSTAGAHRPFIAEDAHATDPVGSWNGNPAVFEKDRSDKPAYVQKNSDTLADGRDIRKAQYRTLMSVDDMVGRVFDKLRAVGEADNTLAFFISDNGMMWGEHGMAGGKSNPYTQSVKVPMLARWPGHFEARSTDHRITANIDIAPTVMRAVGVDPTIPMDGRNLENQKWTRHRILLEFWCANWGCNRWASTRTKRLQYTEYYDSDGAIRFKELYKLKNDPWQLHNVMHDGRSGNNPSHKRLRTLHARLRRDRHCVGTGCP